MKFFSQARKIERRRHRIEEFSLESFATKANAMQPKDCVNSSWWAFNLPEKAYCLAGLNQGQSISAFSNSREQILDPKINFEDGLPLLFLSSGEYFLQAILPFRVHGRDVLSGALCWLQLNPSIGAELFEQEDSSKAAELVSADSFYNPTPLLVMRNGFYLDGTMRGLNALASVSFDFNGFLPVITTIREEVTSAQSIIPYFFHHQDQRSNLEIETTCIKQLRNWSEKTNEHILLEQALREGSELTASNASQFVTTGEDTEHSARTYFALGSVYQQNGDTRRALRFFHHATKLGHPVSKEREREIRAEVFRPFLVEHSEVMDAIKAERTSYALPLLKQLASEYPLAANSVLGSAAISSGALRDGLLACDKSLAIESAQPDLLFEKWFALKELGKHAEALRAALTYLEHYPDELTALEAIAHSALSLGDNDKAVIAASHYFIVSNQPHKALRVLSTVFSATGNWEILVRIYERFYDSIVARSTETTRDYALALMNRGQASQAETLIKSALKQHPTDPVLVNGFLQILLSAHRADDAEIFLRSIIQNYFANGSSGHKLLFVTMLSSLLRGKNKSKEALGFFEEFNFDKIVDATSEHGPEPSVELILSLVACKKIHSARRLFSKLPATHQKDARLSKIQELMHKEL